ncbi:hypothetical protein SLA2020_403070 [Shorea laevis]
MVKPLSISPSTHLSPSPSPPTHQLTSLSSISTSAALHSELCKGILAVAGVSSLEQVNHTAVQAPPPPRQASWADVTKETPKQSLSYHPPVVVDGKVMVKLPRAIRAEGIKVWEDCLIGTFQDDPPNYGRILSMAKRVWGRRCPVSVTWLGKKSFLFKIPDAATRSWILSSGPWHVAHNTLVMRKWEPDFEESHQEPSKISIWVKLWKVPMVFFTPEGLGYISSAIGLPLALDKATADRTRVDYAKVCVEVEVAKAQFLPTVIPVFDEDSPPVDVKVEYPWLPVTCDLCHKKGHASSTCNKKSGQDNKKEWVPIGKRNNSASSVDQVVSTKPPETLGEPLQGFDLCQPSLQRTSPAKSPVDKPSIVSEPMLQETNLANPVDKPSVVSPRKKCQTNRQSPNSPNSFAALASVDDEQAFPPLQHSSISKSPKKSRQASLGVAAATRALVPKSRNTRKVSNSSSEVPHIPLNK